MEIGMSKYLKILLFSLVAFMGCEDGAVGEDGVDGWEKWDKSFWSNYLNNYEF